LKAANRKSTRSTPKRATRKRTKPQRKRTPRDDAPRKTSRKVPPLSKIKPLHKSPPRRSRTADWVHLSDDELLKLRICDLKVQIAGSALEGRIDRLNDELDRKGISFRPHFWLSDEWFCPDGIAGIAIPFYLAHPRLARLERVQMLEVEGGNAEWCFRILRHEAGHAIDNAYQLHRRARWTKHFGKYSETYPDYYRPRPFSKSYVRHLDPWYAQSHPAEDYAETFAVWLTPGSRWRTQYAGWPALKKLQYVDELINQVKHERPIKRSRLTVDPISTIRKTLGEHYEQKRSRYAVGQSGSFDSELLKLFSNSAEYARNLSAASFLRKARPEMRRTISRWTGQYQYSIDNVLGRMIERSSQLKLRLTRPEAETMQDALVMLTAQTMNYLHGGQTRFAL